MKCYLTLMMALFSFFKASAVILEGPRSGYFPEGTNVTLTCLAQGYNTIVWEDINENTVIFIDKTKNTQKAKFDNFVISDAEDNFSLTIVNAQLSDDGFFSCEEGDESRNANVTVEAGPTLSISLNGTHRLSENPLTLTEGDVIMVLCKAEGAKPAVDLRLQFGENEWIEEANVTKHKQGVLSTTEARMAHRVTHLDTTIACQAFGQSSISPVTKVFRLDVQHKPKCQIELENYLAKCHCFSNPAVSTFTMYVNGELKGTHPTLPLFEYAPAKISCQATNDVGTGEPASKFVILEDIGDPDSNTMLVVIIAVAGIVVAVCGCLGLMVLHRYGKSPRQSGGNQPIPTDNEAEEQVPLVLADGKESPELHDFVSKISPTIQRDWEILAIENLGLPADDVKKIIQCNNSCHEQMTSVLDYWARKEDKNATKYKLAELLSQSAVCNDVQCNNCTEVLMSIPGISMQHQNPDKDLSSKTGNLTPESTQRTTGEETIKPYPTDSPKFKELLENVAKVIGHTGALKLSNEYDVVKKEEQNATVQDSVIIGEDITTSLLESGFLKHSKASLEEFKIRLHGCCLFRASNLVGAYISNEDVELELEEYISEISTSIFYDWEILAIEELFVDKGEVEKIIKTYTNFKDQVKASLYIWRRSKLGQNARKCDLEKIVTSSDVYKDGANLAITKESTKEEQNYEGIRPSSENLSKKTGSAATVVIPSTLQELLEEVSKILGDTGTRRISEAYRKYTDEASVEETLIAKSIFHFLQNQKILEDEKESLRIFSNVLKSNLLLRASYLVDNYIATKVPRTTSSTKTPSLQVTNVGSESVGQHNSEDQKVTVHCSNNVKDNNVEALETEKL